jgi:hypothetical protein
MKAYIRNHLLSSLFMLFLGLAGVHLATANPHPHGLGNPFPVSTATTHQLNGLAGALQHLTS